MFPEREQYRFGLAGQGQADVIQSVLQHRPGRVLNIGCGFRGEALDNLARYCLLLIAADKDPRVPKMAASDVFRPNVRLLAADVHQLPFANGCFEHILALGLFFHVPDPVNALKELRRVCHPGSTVMITNSVQHPQEQLRVAAADVGLDVLDEHEGPCPAASGDIKRRYLIVFRARG